MSEPTDTFPEVTAPAKPKAARKAQAQAPAVTTIDGAISSTMTVKFQPKDLRVCEFMDTHGKEHVGLFNIASSLIVVHDATPEQIAAVTAAV